MSKAIRSYPNAGALPNLPAGAILSVAGVPYVSAGGGSWAALDVSALAGTLGVAHGGTGLTSPGASGNVLTSNGSAWVSSPASGAGSVPLEAGGASASAVSGQLHCFSPFIGVATCNGCTFDNLWGRWCVFGKDRTLSTLAIPGNGAVAGAVGRVCIYNVGTDGYPTSLVGYSAEMDLSTSGIKTAAVVGGSCSVLGSATYLYALLPGVATPNLSGISNTGPHYFANSSGALAFRYGLTVAQSYGTPPSTFPAGASLITSNTSVPILLYEV